MVSYGNKFNLHQLVRFKESRLIARIIKINNRVIIFGCEAEYEVEYLLPIKDLFNSSFQVYNNSRISRDWVPQDSLEALSMQLEFDDLIIEGNLTMINSHDNPYT